MVEGVFVQLSLIASLCCYSLCSPRTYPKYEDPSWVQEDFRSQEVISSFYRADDIFCDVTFCWGRFGISIGDHSLESIRRYVYTSSLAMNFVKFVITFTKGSGRQTKPSDAMFWRFSMEVSTEPSRPKVGHFIFKKCVMGGHVYYCVMYCKVLDKQQDRKKCKEIRKSQFREIRKPTSN